MCNTLLPKEQNGDKIGRGGMSLVHYSFNYEHWEFRQETGLDRGKDCSLEYIDENNEWNNSIICAQVKATKSSDTYELKSKDVFSYPLETKTLNYALRSNNAFLLLFCDLTEEIVYYLPLQDYFIENESEHEKLISNNNKTLNIHIPKTNIVRRDSDEELIELANSSYNYNNGKISKDLTD